MNTITERELIEMYDDMLDEIGIVEIGNLTYDPSLVLKKMDAVAYRIGLSEYADCLMTEGYEVEGR